MKTNISIVIPNWNGRHLLEKNLPALFAAKNKKANRIKEIIIVDDKSTDDSLSFLKNTYGDEIIIVAHKVNRGFAAAVNTGFRASRGDIVCLLNTDVIPESNFLISVIPHFKDKSVFGVSLHEKGYAYSVGRFRDGFIVHDPGKETPNAHNTFWVSGGSGVFSRMLWMKLGGLDEVVFAPFYWEDVDLGYRALKRGYKLLWEPKAHVVHSHESVINTNNFLKWKLSLVKERNHLLLNWKNLTSANLMRKHKRGLIRRIVRHPGYIKIVIAAFLKIRAIIKARNKEKREAVLSDEAIFSSFE